MLIPIFYHIGNMKATILGMALMLAWLVAKWPTIDFLTLFIGFGMGVGFANLFAHYMTRGERGANG